MQFQHDPWKIWAANHERLATVNSFSKSTIHTNFARLKYGVQEMDKYLSKWEKFSALLAAMGSPLDESLLISMFFESFGSKNNSMFGGAISALLTKDKVSWQQICATMLEEYKSSKSSDPGMGNENQSKRSHSANMSERNIIARSWVTSGRDATRGNVNRKRNRNVRTRRMVMMIRQLCSPRMLVPC